jgi:hypothetical protein
MGGQYNIVMARAHEDAKLRKMVRYHHDALRERWSHSISSNDMRIERLPAINWNWYQRNDEVFALARNLP